MTLNSTNTPNHLLRRAREHKGWSQEQVAAQIGASAFSVHRWERGFTFPTSYYCQRLSMLFGMSLEELGLSKAELHHAASPQSPAIWNIPYQQNPFFTGRKDALTTLAAFFQKSKATKGRRCVMLHGLGGVGKTHVAIEYAYRHIHEYEAILWVGADPEPLVRESFCHLASVLNIVEQQDQQQTILAIQRWLADHHNWLLIFDNVEDMDVIPSLIPKTNYGHILLTTRLQSAGDLAQQIEMDVMTPEEATLLLLRQAKIIPSGASSRTASSLEQRDAHTLASIMDGLLWHLTRLAHISTKQAVG